MVLIFATKAPECSGAYLEGVEPESGEWEEEIREAASGGVSASG